MYQNAIQQGLSYSEYRQHINDLVAINLTTGIKQTPALLEFTKLNIHRMNRLDKTISISNAMSSQLKQIQQPQIWLLVAEAWCGDCAQILPIIAKIAEQGGDKITLKIIGKDTDAELMNAYLTNGGMSVPKLIILDKKNLAELTTWGPRPMPAQEIMLHWKANKDTISIDTFEKELHLWYARNKGIAIMEELIASITPTLLT